MKPIRTSPSRAEQAYQAILDEICAGALPPGTHLVQERLAERLGVSRQPIQQAMALLKNDGVVRDLGKRGLCVAPLDLTMMRHHYDVRSVIDGLAARRSAERAANSRTVAREIERRGLAILDGGRKAVRGGAIPRQIDRDVAFHTLFYESAGNPLLAVTAERHWRFLRRVMGEVLRHAEPPQTIWREHAEILKAVVQGRPDLAERRAIEHVSVAADLLADALGKCHPERIKA